MAQRLWPVVDVSLVAAAAAIWYVRPQVGWWPAGFLAAGWLLRLLVTGRLTRRTPFDLPLALFMVTALVAASIGYNQGSEWARPEAPQAWAWAKFFYILTGISLYYAIANMDGPGQVWWLVRGLALFAAGVAAYFLLTNDWGAMPNKLDALARVAAWLDAALPALPGRRLHPNVAGGLTAMLLPWFVPLALDALRRRARLESALWTGAAALALAGVALSVSRGAWLAVAGVAGLWLALSLAGRLGRAAVAALVVALAVVGAALALGTGLLASLAGTAVVAGLPGSGAAVNRLDLWQAAWTLAQDYLFTGAGLGAFSMLFTAYVMPVQLFIVLHSHNLLLDVLVEQGIGGLAAYLWLLAGLALLAARGLASETDPRRRWLIQAALASAGVAVLHGITDDIAYGSRAVLLSFVPLGVIAALRAQAGAKDWRVPWRAVAAAAALAVVLIIWQREPVAASWLANQGASSQARVELSAYSFPDRLPETMRRQADLAEAMASYQEALRLDPSQPTANRRLAGIALARGDYEAALAYAQAAGGGEGDIVRRQLLGDAYLALGQQDEAYEQWSRVPAAGLLLTTEAAVRYDPVGDKLRAAWTRALAERVAAGR